MSVILGWKLSKAKSHRAEEIKQRNVETCGAYSINQVKDISRRIQDFESRHTTGTIDMSVRIVQ
jgi:hypothetical protein